MESRKTVGVLWEEYRERHGFNQKHDFSHFIRVISMLSHHETYIRPKILWLTNKQINK